jgi:transmembrane sensor
VELVRGELLATVAKAPDRPFQVVTRDLTATALGTEYSVRLDDCFTRVTVQESKVAVTSRDGGDESLELSAGQQADLNRDGVLAREATASQRPDWADGRLAFSNALLTDVIERLARHRPGLLTLDDALANSPRRFTGVLPADDSDAALTLLADTLNLEVRYLTPWYVTVHPVSQ